MRGQCGIAVVAATLATGKSTTPSRDAVAAPPHHVVSTRGSPAPSALEAAIAVGSRGVAPPPTGSRDGKPLLRVLPKGSWSARQEGSCADATPCCAGVLPTRARRVRRRGFLGPTAARDAAGGDAGRADRSRGAGSSSAGARAADAGDMHNDVLLVRGGGGTSWFRSEYDEFPPDFDYEPTEDGNDDDGGGDDDDDGSAAFCWPEDDEDPAGSASAAAGSISSKKKKLDLKDFLEEEDGALIMKRKDLPDLDGVQQGRSRRPDRKTLPPAEGGPASPPVPAVKSAPPRFPVSAENHGNWVPSSALTAAAATAPERVANANGSWDRNRVGGMLLPLGAVVGALAGAVGLRLWEVLVHRYRRSGGGDSGGGDSGGGDGGGKSVTEGGVGGEEGGGQIEGTAVAAEAAEAVGAQQAKIQALEDQLSYLEEDRRRVLLAAKEARSNRRKDDRQLKEYVHTLEVHLDQLSKEKQESETAVVETVRAETAKALEQAQQGTQAAAVKAAEEVKRARGELDAAQALLEEALRDKAAAVQEKAASDALLRTEQGKGAALEKEVERLRESTVALTQRLLDTVAEAERAGKDERDAIQARAHEATEAAVAAAAAAAREEETARCREEMEVALAEEKEELRKQMEARVATMRAGLKRRLQEARAERAGTASGIPSSERVAGVAGSSSSSNSGSSSSSSRPK